jgi:ABC-type transporter Mla MlaB component
MRTVGCRGTHRSADESHLAGGSVPTKTPEIEGDPSLPEFHPRPGAPPAARHSSSIVLVISGPVAGDQVEALCRRIEGLLKRSEADLVICDVAALDDPDAATVDLVARLQLTARRFGRRVRLLDACGELQDLIELTGLSEFVSFSAGSDLEPRWESEQREEPARVEEEGDPADQAT